MSEVSNIRKRKRIDPTSEEFDPEMEVLEAAQQGRRPRLFPQVTDDDDMGFTFNERIWVEYGIKPNLPTRSKIEQLFVLYRLPAEEIASVLAMGKEDVEEHLETLNSEWQNLGRVMTPEEREIARGRMVSELLKLKAEIEEAMMGATSADKARMLTLKMNVVNQLTQLQGLTLDKKEVIKPEDEGVDPIEQRVKELSEERQKELHARLRAAIRPQPQ